MINGILLVDKPAGWTSHDVVAKVRSTLKKETGQKVKVGHTGTLDPSATGLLVLVIGSYTKRANEFSKLDKTYEAELTLGKISTTGDIEGRITPYIESNYQKKTLSRKILIPSDTNVSEVLRSFEGKIEQTPHAYSAIKVDGQRAYKLAREGKTPHIEPRLITIYSLELLNYSYPTLKIRTRVSSGTYIRSLAEDIGKKLDTGAYLSALRRTEVGKFNIQEAISLHEHSVALSKHLLFGSI